MAGRIPLNRQAEHAGQRADPADPGAGGAGHRVRVGEVPPVAEAFTARPETAAGLDQALDPGTALALVTDARAGLPQSVGVSGQTQIAAGLAEWLWQSAAVDLLVWISATSRASVLSGLVEAFAAATGITPAGTAESVAARFAAQLARSSQPWLLVLDDLSDPADLEGAWPLGPAGRVLITARRPETAVGLPGTQVIPVGPVSVREALAFLTEHLSPAPAQRRGAVDLADSLDGDPLALTQAAAVITTSGVSCMDYRERFLAAQEDIAASRGEIPGSAPVTWLLSLEMAEQMLPGQSIRLMLAMIALLDGHGIPVTVFSAPAAAAWLSAMPPQGAFLDPPDDQGGPWEDESRHAWEVLLTLERVGLVWLRRPSQPQVPATAGMSLAVQEAIRHAMPGDMHRRVAQTAANALLEAWPSGAPGTWIEARLRASALVLQRESADALWAEDGCHPLLLRTGYSLDAVRLTGPAADYWRELADVGGRMLGPGHPAVVVIAARLGAAYLTAGRALDAVACYRQVLDDYQRILAVRPYDLPPDYPGIMASARAGLGRALIMAGDPAAAVAVLREAAAETGRLRGPGQPDTLAVQVALATAYHAAGEEAEARGLLQRSLADSERAQGPRAADTMTIREHLAAGDLAAGRAKEALSQAKRLLADRERTLGPAHPDTIAAHSLVASACHLAGRMTSALQHAEQAQADSERVLGADHRHTLTRSLELARIYYEDARLGDAARLLRDTAARCVLVLPPGDPLTRAAQQSLAATGAG